MGRADFLRLGDFNAICYFCGWKRKASEMEKNWQGFYVCPNHNEPRQPQDFVRAIPDDQTTPWAQPDPIAVYTFDHAQLAIADGVTKSYQAGSGLGPTAVTIIVHSTYVNGIIQSVSVLNGLISWVIAPPKGGIITWTGTETVLA